MFLLGTNIALLLKEKPPSMLSDMLRIVRSHQLPVSTAPTEPLLCKFADGGQKKRQNPNKYIPNGRPWHREGEVRLVSPFLKLECGCAILNTHGKPALQGHLDWTAHTSETVQTKPPCRCLVTKRLSDFSCLWCKSTERAFPGRKVEMGRATLRFCKNDDYEGV